MASSVPSNGGLEKRHDAHLISMMRAGVSRYFDPDGTVGD